jgi:triosephosphate isomerase
MKNLVVANWKMNPISQKEAEDIFEKVKCVAKVTNVEVVVCPPFIYLFLLKELALRTPSSLGLGGQNICSEEKGAFTGEVSAIMLKDLGIEYVIIGHSERRKYFNETDESVNKKIKLAINAKLKVIFCIGETADERGSGKKNEVLERQIKQGLAGIENLNDINIAYEPVWAIGTGNNCSVEETRESILFIKKFVGNDMRVLYGGSVKSENSGAYIKEAMSNGLLVGGASLIAEEFVKIIKSVG